MKGMDSILNLFLDRIYMINWIFLVPHFPEENADTQSDYVGNKYGMQITPRSGCGFSFATLPVRRYFGGSAVNEKYNFFSFSASLR
jgi:hypothetical protein